MREFPTENRIDTSFHSDSKVLPQIEAFVRDAVVRLIGTVPDEHLYNVFLVATEAANNAIVHGNKADGVSEFNFSIAWDSPLLWMQTKDNGAGFNPDELPDPTSPENLLSAGGRGIFLIKSFCEEFTVIHNGSHNIVTMALRLEL